MSFSTWSAAITPTEIYEAAAVNGRIVQIAFLNGKEATIDLSKIMTKRLHHTGSTLRPRSVEDKAAMVKAIEADAMPWLLDGRVKPLIDSTFPLKDAPKAHRPHRGRRTYWQNCAHALGRKLGFIAPLNPLIYFIFVSFIAFVPACLEQGRRFNAES